MPSILTRPEFLTEEAAIAYVEARLWPVGPVCPHCHGNEKLGRLKGKSNRPGLWKCYACRKPFTVRIGTIFESSHLPLRVWLQVIHLMMASKKGISTQQIHRLIGGSMKTAWFLGHRIRECMKDVGKLYSVPMSGPEGTVEVDETYIGRKSTSKAFKAPAEKQAVVALVERGGAVRSFHVPNVTAANLHPIIAQQVSRRSKLMTDESNLYSGVGWNFGGHGTVNHGKKEYVADDGVTHTNTVEGCFSVLKRGIYGVYQHVSEAHLQRYLNEFDFRYSNRAKLGIDDKARADLALRGAKGKRLTYRKVSGERAATPST